MKFKLQLVCEPGEYETAYTDEIFTFDKPFDTFENIGLSLCESKQLLSMQWTKKGAHLLLQVRTKVLNDEWEDIFRKMYPDFWPIKSVKDPDIIQQAA